MTSAVTGYSGLRERAAWLDLSGRGKIRVTGEDRARLLHAITTNHIEQLKPGQGCYAFFLNAQGRILGDANILCFEDYFLLDTEPETRAKLYDHLERYIIADDVSLKDETEQFATIALEGPEAAEVLKNAGSPVPDAPYSHISWQNCVIARIDSTGSGGFFLFVPREEKDGLTSLLAKSGAAEATAEEARTVRIEHGRPRYGDEVTERFLVQETGQLQGVHFNKGCYLGQEIVERVRSRAQIHRVLRKLELETEHPPAAGLKTEAAEIASAAFSPAISKTVALAYVRTSFAEPGSEFLVDGVKARVL